MTMALDEAAKDFFRPSPGIDLVGGVDEVAA